MSKSLSFPFMPPKQRWPFFAGILIVLTGVLTFFAGWEIGLLVSPFIAYLAAAVSFNRVEVEFDEKRVSWKDRPFPMRRQKQFKLSEIDSWVHGATPSSGKSSGSPTYSVAILRNNKKINRAIDGLRTRAEATTIAIQLSSATGLPERPLQSLRGAPGAKSNNWILVAAFAGFLSFAALMIWLSQS